MHRPFFTCVLVVLAAVVLSYCSVSAHTDNDNNNRNDNDNDNNGVKAVLLDEHVLMECGCARNGAAQEEEELTNVGPAPRVVEKPVNPALTASREGCVREEGHSQPSETPTPTPDPDSVTIIAQSGDSGAAACVCKRMRRPIRPIRCNKYPGNSTEEHDPECSEPEEDDSIPLWSDIERNPEWYLPAVRIIGKLGFKVINGTFDESSKEWQLKHGYDVLSALSLVTRISIEHTHILGVTRGPLATDFDMFTRNATTAEVVIGEIQESVGNGSFSRILEASFAPKKVKVILLSIAARRISVYRPQLPAITPSTHHRIISKNATIIRFNHTVLHANHTHNHSNIHNSFSRHNNVSNTAPFEDENQIPQEEVVVVYDNKTYSEPSNLPTPPPFMLPDLDNSEGDIDGGALDIKLPGPAIDVRCGTPKNVRRVGLPAVGVKLKHHPHPPPPEQPKQLDSQALGASINHVESPQAKSLVSPPPVVTETLLEELQRLRKFVEDHDGKIADLSDNISKMILERASLQSQLNVRQKMMGSSM